jgi:hypothetical protein
MIEIVIIVCAMTTEGPMCLKGTRPPPEHLEACEQFDETAAAYEVKKWELYLRSRGVTFTQIGVGCQEKEDQDV